MTKILTWLMVCVITGIAGISSLEVARFVGKVEDETVCGQCDRNASCFARKKIFKDSNFLSEFMLLSFYKVHNKCEHTSIIPTYQKLIYFFCNAILVSVLFWSREYNITCVVFGISATMMLALSVVDWNTRYIPVEYTGIIFLCGLIHLFADYSNWLQYLIGLIAVSGFLCIVNWIATPVLRKRYEGVAEVDGGIGDGDIKLMAATGLLLGWKLNFIALGIGCVAGSVIQLILMKIKKGEQQFALGPYISLGVYITMICGEQLVSWYLNMMGGMPYNNF